jgi:hypothetical protein
MNKTLFLGGVSMVFAALTFAQAIPRQAAIRGGGSPDQGKCTIEVFVDGSAEVQIQGASATLRTTSGQPAQWRRFECNSPMPANPPNFRFSGVDGRGRQVLIRDPRNGGAAVVQIEDKDGGAEGYTFDITWEGANQGALQSQGSPSQRRQSEVQGRPESQGPDRYREYSDERYRPDYRESQYYRRYGHGFAVDDAIEVCRQEIMRQATRRFRSADFHIRRTDIDDGPGRNDSVLGSLDVHTGPRGERYNFSCSVDFQNGRVRSAQISPQPIRY